MGVFKIWKINWTLIFHFPPLEAPWQFPNHLGCQEQWSGTHQGLKSHAEREEGEREKMNVGVPTCGWSKTFCPAPECKCAQGAWPSLQERLASESQHRLETFFPSGACCHTRLYSQWELKASPLVDRCGCRYWPAPDAEYAGLPCPVLPMSEGLVPVPGGMGRGLAGRLSNLPLSQQRFL